MENQNYFSLVLETPAATPEDTHRHYMNKLSVETDVSDVRYDMQHGANNFLLIDVRAANAFNKCHISGAISLPYRQMIEETTALFSKEQAIVVYCWLKSFRNAIRDTLYNLLICMVHLRVR